MTRLHLPPKTLREIEKEKWVRQRAEHRALAARLLDFDDPVCQEWTPHLRDIDPLLALGRGRNRAYGDGVEIGVRPGYFHIVRRNDTAPWTIHAITGPDGESYMDPDSGMLEDLKRSDLQNPKVCADLIAAQEEREARREREIENERAELNEDVLERFKAGTRAQVSMSSDVPWSQNAAGQRDARERKKKAA